MNPDLQKSMAFGNVASLPPFVLVGRGGENEFGGVGGVLCPGGPLSTTDFTWTGLGSSPRPCG